MKDIHDGKLNNEMLPEHKAIRHNQFNEYVFNEVVPFIRNSTSNETMIYTCGASNTCSISLSLWARRCKGSRGNSNCRANREWVRTDNT